MTVNDVGKRTFDLIFSILSLFPVVPILVLSSIFILITSRGPVFFTQLRAGRNGESFRIYKLRTMTVNPDRDAKQTTLDDSEVYPVGRILRRLKIDELPQTFNVLMGNMSIVGPRPCLLETLDTMPIWAKKRFKTRPGMTGLAQIQGNVALSWEDRWRYDVEYVEQQSLLFDIKIIFKTLFVVFLGEEKFRINQ